MNKGQSDVASRRKWEYSAIDPKKKKKAYICPYEVCKKVFSESGNLKRHLRSHVSPSLDGHLIRRESGLMPALTQLVGRTL